MKTDDYKYAQFIFNCPTDGPKYLLSLKSSVIFVIFSVVHRSYYPNRLYSIYLVRPVKVIFDCNIVESLIINAIEVTVNTLEVHIHTRSAR